MADGSGFEGASATAGAETQTEAKTEAKAEAEAEVADKEGATGPSAAAEARPATAWERIRTDAEAPERDSRLEAELARLTRLANLGDLLAEAVHELRNPLVSVKTFLQLLPESLDDPDFHGNFREQVVDEVRRMERLLDAILDHARPGETAEGEARATVGGVLESVGRLLEKRALEKQLKLVVDIGADLPAAAIDEDPLRQVLLNLTLNAFEASPPRGCVRLTATCEATADESARRLRIDVDDEGPGVPASERERLFEAFHSTRAERPVGLGLAVCQRLVGQASGELRVEDAPSTTGGARFCVLLPTA